MTCKYCGNEIQDSARFCPHCGRVNDPGPEGQLPSAPYSAPTPAWEGPEGGPKKKKTGLILGAAAAVAAIALVVTVVSGMFSDPKAQVEKAAVKSAAAYVQAKKALDLPELDKLREGQSVSQLVAVELSGLDTALLGYDLSPLEGLSMRMLTDLDVQGRTMGMELSGHWDDQELLRLQLAVDDAELYFASPQFTGGTFYGVNTETLGEDLRQMGSQDVEDISFNLFDIMDPLLDTDRYKEAERAVRQANKDLWKAVKVEKGGKEKIGAAQTEATAYRLTVPQQAMEDYADALIGAMSAVDYASFYRELFQAVGAPEEAIEELLDQLENMDPYEELSEALEDAIDELGDVHLTVYVGGGYVSAVEYESYLENGRGAHLRLALYLGGGEEYVDDLRLEVKVDDQMIVIDSTGDHGCKTGTFTDETTIRGPFTSVTSQLEYIPGASVPEGNLTWTVEVPGAGSLEMEGDLQCGEDSFELHLERMGIKVLGLELATLKADYQMGPCTGPRYSLDSAQLVPEMEGLALMQAYVTVGANIQTWAQDMEELFTARLPAELLDMLM